jgi:two-component system sensor histidine kinase HydH
MSAVLAHEIRNPLASLKGHAQLLAESLEGDSEKETKANRVVHEAIRLETLTTDLLDFVRTGKICRTQVNPADLIHRAAMDVDSDRIVAQTDAAPASFAMDGDRMQQALVNLLSNGLQASDEGKVVARVEGEADRLVFTVTDSGKGIPEDRLEDMFAPFHTTKVRGTGLGLAVVRRIVELHGGTVTASNAKDGGAQFRIEIPEES